MTKDQVKVGETYRMNHTSGRIEVKILSVHTVGGYRAGSRNMTHWRALNLKTGREIEVKSAAKLSPVIRIP